MTTQVKERYHWVDVAKGLLIILLLVHHFSSATRRLGISNDQFWFVTCWQIIYTCFFMQAFFFLSGYCSNFSHPAKRFFTKLLKQLIIPFVCFQLIICISNTFAEHGFSLRAIYDYWLGVNGTTLWFLNALIVSKIIVWMCLRINKSFIFLLSFSFALLLFAIYLKQKDLGSNFFYIRQSLAAVFFVAFGHFIKHRQDILKYVRIGALVFPYLLLFMLLLNIPIPQVTAEMQVGLLSAPIFVLVSLCGTCACIEACKIIGKFKPIEYIGRNTLVVYCLHFLVLLPLAGVLYKVLSPSGLLMSIVYVLVLYVSVLFVCVFLIELFNLKPLRWMIGRV